jgi:outer membrane protein assembly factor BamD (BamD/ComL family)
MSVGHFSWTIGFCLGCCLGLCPLRARAADDDARQRAVLRDFNAAAALQNAGLYDRAGEKWTTFISQYPSDGRLDRAYYYLGIAQLHSKKYTAAIATFQTLASKYPAFPNGEGVQYSLGMARYQAALESKNRTDDRVPFRFPARVMGLCEMEKLGHYCTVVEEGN